MIYLFLIKDAPNRVNLAQIKLLLAAHHRVHIITDNEHYSNPEVKVSLGYSKEERINSIFADIRYWARTEVHVVVSEPEEKIHLMHLRIAKYNGFTTIVQISKSYYEEVIFQEHSLIGLRYFYYPTYVDLLWVSNYYDKYYYEVMGCKKVSVVPYPLGRLPQCTSRPHPGDYLLCISSLGKEDDLIVGIKFYQEYCKNLSSDHNIELIIAGNGGEKEVKIVEKYGKGNPKITYLDKFKVPYGDFEVSLITYAKGIISFTLGNYLPIIHWDALSVHTPVICYDCPLYLTNNFSNLKKITMDECWESQVKEFTSCVNSLEIQKKIYDIALSGEEANLFTLEDIQYHNSIYPSFEVTPLTFSQMNKKFLQWHLVRKTVLQDLYFTHNSEEKGHH